MPNAKNLILIIFKFFFADITNSTREVTDEIVDKNNRPEEVGDQEI